VSTCTYGVEWCGQLRMKSERGSEGFVVSVVLGYCPQHTTEQVERAAKELIVSVGQLAGLLKPPAEQPGAAKGE
jgi:hypothetical protein